MLSKIQLRKKQSSLDKKEALVDKILFLETNSEFYSFFRNMYLTLGRLCNDILYFNRRENYFKYGKDKMNQMLLKLIAKEKPDYVFTWLTWDEFYIDTLLKINEISPKTKTVVILGDDTIQFEDFSRYYALLFNCVFTTLKSYQKRYKEEGIKDVYFTSLTDATNFHPIKTEKKYDVTFIGSQKLDKAGRYEMIKYLKDNGISVKVFGFGWENYPEIKDVYGGPLESDQVVKVTNESKINLCFSKDNIGRPQMKAKIFEVGACNSFTLCEYAPDYDNYFDEGKDIVFFKNQEELLNKVKYYLAHDKEREKIAKAAYSRVVREYALQTELKNFIKSTRNKIKKVRLPELGKSVHCMTSSEIDLGTEKLKNLVAKYDYVSFKTSKAEHLKYKDYFQIYGLIKSGKHISCCNYYMHSGLLGDYMLFFTRDGAALLDKQAFNSMLDINQLVVSKDYFLENYLQLKQAFHGKTIDFVNKDTTTFVAIPLVRLRKLKTKNYEVLKKAFGFKFIYRLYASFFQKKFLVDPFTYALLFQSLTTKRFIMRALRDNLKDKNIWAKFKKLK